VDKFTFTRALAKYVVNPITKLGAGRVPGTALLETRGQRSGRPRVTPVGYSREGSAVWIVSEHGRRADYVRNIEKEPNVRMKIRGRWHRGRAQVVPDEDPRKHLAKQTNKLSSATVRIVGTDPVAVRIDLGPR
jgi:deazaflavin-dependent oxidoreductase (nitroreductase family)